jgi:uncharacterized repeat protein (TIGR02543 family)
MKTVLRKTFFPGMAALLAAIAMLGMMLSGCPNSNVDPAQYTITFLTHGGSAVDEVTADAGTAVEEPAPPTKDGHTFTGWFSEETGGTMYTWPHTVSADITMHAQWQEDTLPTLTGTVSVTGTAQVGETLTANTDSLDGSGTISYQWQRGDSASGSFADISSAVGSTYTLVAEDQGKYVRVEVSRAGNTGTITSNDPVNVPSPVSKSISIGFNYGAITITGDDKSNIIYKTSADPASITLSATEDYTDVNWYVDGESSPVEGASITLDASAYSAKTHSVTFTGKKDGRLYSQVIPFTVRN